MVSGCHILPSSASLFYMLLWQAALCLMWRWDCTLCCALSDDASLSFPIHAVLGRKAWVGSLFALPAEEGIGLPRVSVNICQTWNSQCTLL